MATLILLAAGKGTRFNSSLPKQFLPLKEKRIALYSFDLFASCKQVREIVVVCDPMYQHFFSNHTLFAPPGATRQQSVYSGLLKSTSEMILIHDSARPLFDLSYLPPLLEAANRTGAAALGAPVTSTIKKCAKNYLVEKTLDRALLWEIQTPQAIRREILFKAFEHMQKHNLQATDDISMVEALSLPTEIVPSTTRNIKITTPFDLVLAETLLSKELCAIN